MVSTEPRGRPPPPHDTFQDFTGAKETLQDGYHLHYQNAATGQPILERSAKDTDHKEEVNQFGRSPSPAPSLSMFMPQEHEEAESVSEQPAETGEHQEIRSHGVDAESDDDVVEIDDPGIIQELKRKYGLRQFGAVDFDLQSSGFTITGSASAVKQEGDEDDEDACVSSRPNEIIPSLSARNNGTRSYFGGFEENEADDSDYHPGSRSDSDNPDGEQREPLRSQKSKTKKVQDQGKEAEQQISEQDNNMRTELAHQLLAKRKELNELKERGTTGSLTVYEELRLEKLRGECFDLEVQLILNGDSRGETHDENTTSKTSKTQTTGSNKSTTQPQKQQVRRPRPRTAAEWWAQYYQSEDKSASNWVLKLNGREKRKAEAVINTHQQNPKRQKRNKDPSSIDVLDTLRDPDTAEALASQAEGLITNAVVDTTKAGREKQLQNLIANAPAAKRGGLRHDKNILTQASQSFGYGKCKAKDGGWAIPGLRNAVLYDHQVVGVSWMLAREFSPDGPWGGILADEMGLGKTLQLICVILCNRPTREAKKRGQGATLIVVPASVIRQWNREIQKFTKLVVNVYRKKMAKDVHLQTYCQSEVVLTSYQEVFSAFPPDIDVEQNSDFDQDDLDPENDERFGDLYRIKFHRIILDEAHIIKNRHSRISQACRVLVAPKNRWAVTGTPVQNYSEEIYPYLNFMKFPEATDFQAFKKTSYKKLNQLVPHLLIHRSVKDYFMGRPLLNIPKPCKPQDIWVNVSEEEEIFYRSTEKKFRAAVNAALANGTCAMNKGHFVYLTFLRMLTSHVFNGEKLMRKYLSFEDIKNCMDEFKGRGSKAPIIDQIGHMILKATSETEGQTIDLSSGSSSSQRFQFASAFGQLAAEKAIDEILCRACLQFLEDAVISDDCATQAEERAGGPGLDPVRCPICNMKQTGPFKSFDTDEFQGLDTASQTSTATAVSSRPLEKKGGRSGKGKHGRPLREFGDDFNRQQPKVENSKIFEYVDAHSEEPVPTSAKTATTMRIVHEWQAEAPDDCIIIFTHFLPVMKLLGRLLQQRGIEWLYFWGGLGQDAKDQAVQTFTEKPEVKVMIVSLGCGGQALNLTVANRVILMDLWWNDSYERQGFGRVYRIDQKKQTHFVRILAKNTIDTRLYEMQRKKKKAIGKIFGTEPGEEADEKDPGPTELPGLLGTVRQTSDGIPQVEADYDDREAPVLPIAGVEPSGETEHDDEDTGGVAQPGSVGSSDADGGHDSEGDRDGDEDDGISA
ncbi:hypothetical protein M406DRAFT_69158 [Cryphonectria parasitica EP155]|uniref:Uncharacterized protein n=1 Tax=Cryphonectria parasitica (strain ATCC 38755 / EP155) TaxID=660469 RepID=A0A9P5CPZ0_CRYP1|nr:uncharacterized protein M406DRAFT_69158 [Cryphonectria parasitica EP155]KAF3766984.1 hypothetical protein M406DRAFT_69158 [Cryphonectria parasitica EP155]